MWCQRDLREVAGALQQILTIEERVQPAIRLFERIVLVENRANLLDLDRGRRRHEQSTQRGMIAMELLHERRLAA